MNEQYETPVDRWYGSGFVYYDDAGTQQTALYGQFIEWCMDNEIRVFEIPSIVKWAKQLSALGYKKMKQGGRHYIPLRVDKMSCWTVAPYQSVFDNEGNPNADWQAVALQLARQIERQIADEGRPGSTDRRNINKNFR